MGRNLGGRVVIGLFVFALAKCGETKTTAPVLQPTQPPVALTHEFPAQRASAPPVPSAPVRSLFAEAPAAPEPPPKVHLKPIKRTLYVTGKEVPLRAAPDAKAKILNRLPNGMRVGELSRREGWVEIRHPLSAIEGWVSARRLSEAAPQTEETKTEEQPKPKRKEPPGIEVLSDAAIIAKLIALDAAAYSGNCRCPENRDRAGRRCGARSAYSKPGGWAPLCYPGDVSREAIAEFRASGGRYGR